MVSNNILTFFCGLVKFYFVTVYAEVKATIVAYAGLRVKCPVFKGTVCWYSSCWSVNEWQHFSVLSYGYT